MYESETNTVQRALLVAADCGEWDAEASIAELARLAESAGAEVVGEIVQQRQEYDRATVIGRGKLAEVRLMADNLSYI